MIDIRDTKKFSYFDFYIMQEHKPFWNIIAEEELARTKNVENVDIYFISFVKFLKIAVTLQNVLDNYDMINELDENLPDEFLELCWSDCSDYSSFDDIKEEISDIEIKSSSKTKILKFLLQTYACLF